MLRCIPKSTAPASGVSAYGRSYSAAAGTVLDVPDQDAGVLGANGYIVIANGRTSAQMGVGTTANRPTRWPNGQLLDGSQAGVLYIDTSIAAVIVWDGAVWRNVITGAAV